MSSDITDDRKRWRPRRFRTELWGCEERFTFPSVKLLDYAAQEEELTTSQNPFAIVVLAHLKTRATRKNPEDRLQWKLHLVRLLYERGYERQDILNLFRFIDWMMTLPDALAERFAAIIFQYEEEHRMKYVTSVERHGIKKGRQEGRLENSREDIVDILRVRFEWVPDALIEAINVIDDLAILKQLHRDAVTVGSLEEFTALLDRQAVVA